MNAPATMEQARRTIMVTGFGPFPGVPRNPTQGVLVSLERHRSRFERLGIAVRTLLLPVRFDAVGALVAEAALAQGPDAILHLGADSRRRCICVETRAINRGTSLRPDASHARTAQILVSGAQQTIRTTYPARRIQTALRRKGFDTILSTDAGGYVCNATLFASLRGGLAPEIGFLHLPRRCRILTRSGGEVTLAAWHLSEIVMSTILAMSRPPVERPFH